MYVEGRRRKSVSEMERLFIHLRQNNFLFRHFCWPFFFINRRRKNKEKKNTTKNFPFVIEIFLSDNGRQNSLFSVLYLMFCVCLCVYVCLKQFIWTVILDNNNKQATVTVQGKNISDGWMNLQFSIPHLLSSLSLSLTLFPLTKLIFHLKKIKRKRKKHERFKGYSRLDKNVTNPVSDMNPKKSFL